MSVSVIVPTYNAERYIGEALASVRQQAANDLQVVVVDDGSTDNTVSVVQQFADSLDLLLIRQPNAGPAAARNAGIRSARGRYCAFLDADDVMLPERIAVQCELLDEQPNLGLVHTDLMTFDDGGIIHETRRAFSDPRGGQILERLLFDNFITTSTVMAPTQRLFDAGLFSEGRRVSEDFELWLRIAARWEVGYVDRPLVKYRRRSGSLSGNKLATALCALEVVNSFWDANPDYRRAHRATYRRSLAGHLATAGKAALAQGHRGAALRYLAYAFAHDPLFGGTWKSLAKAAVTPARRGQYTGKRAVRETM